MNTWKVIFATLVIFITGVITGSLLIGYSGRALRPVSHKPVREEPAHPPQAAAPTNVARENRLPAPLPGPLRKDFLDRLGKEIKLSAAQRERIEKIISEGQEAAKELWLEIEPDMHLTLVDTREKIRAELSPEQQAKFGELLKPKARPTRPAVTNAPADKL